MRRKEKEITDKTEIEEIIAKSSICRIALAVDNEPYLVPLCFGYLNNTLYFHSADEGRKLEMIKMNPRVCFEFEGDTEIIKAKKACNWGLKYRSVIGFGNARIIEDEAERMTALDAIMNQYSNEKWDYAPSMLTKTLVFKIEIDTMTGKKASE
ncbi:pyridoxamine 5'-phosphate oxidase family protein [bacterium]|nr:pyridoxamine 5'-phosphate oxidase family protein [bacterium]